MHPRSSNGHGKISFYTLKVKSWNTFPKCTDFTKVILRSWYWRYTYTNSAFKRLLYNIHSNNYRNTTLRFTFLMFSTNLVNSIIWVPSITATLKMGTLTWVYISIKGYALRTQLLQHVKIIIKLYKEVLNIHFLLLFSSLIKISDVKHFLNSSVCLVFHVKKVKFLTNYY